MKMFEKNMMDIIFHIIAIDIVSITWFANAQDLRSFKEFVTVIVHVFSEKV